MELRNCLLHQVVTHLILCVANKHHHHVAVVIKRNGHHALDSDNRILNTIAPFYVIETHHLLITKRNYTNLEAICLCGALLLDLGIHII